MPEWQKTIGLLSYSAENLLLRDEEIATFKSNKCRFDIYKINID